jgi:hypothetical protein
MQYRQAVGEAYAQVSGQNTGQEVPRARWKI